MDLNYNLKKLCYNCINAVNIIDLELNGYVLSCAREMFKYSGVNDKIRKFVCSMSVRRNTGAMPISVRMELLNRKCVPVLLYGLSFRLYAQDRKRLSVAYRNAYRHFKN